MITAFFSCGDTLMSSVAVEDVVQIDASTPRQLIEALEARQSGWSDRLLRPDGALRSDVALLVNVVRHADGRLLDGENTRFVRSLDEQLRPEDRNVLVSLFRPDEIVRFLLESLAGESPSDSSQRGSKARLLSRSSATHNGQTLFARAEPEPIYGFTSGKPVSQLLVEDEINISRDQLLPRSLAEALAIVLDAPSDLDVFRLRAFQEDVLRYALAELHSAESGEASPGPLLLSIPTGGGKTEAFLSPLLAHLLDGRERARRRGREVISAVRAMVVYPTRALANDQARRLAQILLEVNAQNSPDAQLSLGVLTGDTPSNARRLSAQSSLLQLCPRCSAVLTQFEERSGTSNDTGKISIARCSCGVEVDFFRFTREDVLAQPPDILVISPDMMSRTLQLPHFNSRLFTPHLRAIALDEIHVYSGAFGCHVAHLLRRVEDACGTKPLYLGVSATIRNAREVACSLFDAAPEEVRYLRPKRLEEAETPERRSYLDFEAGPTRYRHHYALAPGRVAGGRFAKTTNVTHVVGHLLRDPHFRKTLVFSNGRDATDDIVRFGRDHEERFFLPFSRDLWPRLQATSNNDASTDAALPLSKAENDIIASVGGWYERAWRSGNLHAAPLEFGWHRGGLETKERLRAVNRFVATRRLSAVRGESPWPLDILSATSTLELGLDIGDVSVVVNCGAPFTVNEYTQRIGRGGRRKDALALTLVDPSNALDRRFLRRFARYASPHPDDFEAVPLVVANRDVCRAHILARLFDRVAQAVGADALQYEGSSASELCVGHLRRFSLSIDGRSLRLSDDPHVFAQALWNELFPPEGVQARLAWLRREAQLVPGAQETTLKEEEWHGWWMEKCESLSQLLNKTDISDAQPLTGASALDAELVPDLRGVGATVGLYWRTPGGDEVSQDAVALRTALAARPVGGGASQGSLTFRIKGADADFNAQLAWNRLLREPGIERATAYFHRAFGRTRGEEVETTPSNTDEMPAFPSKPRDVSASVHFITPTRLEIEFRPARFYCAGCGATYSHYS